MIPKRLISLSYRAKLLLAILIVNIPMFIILSANEIVAVRDFAIHRELDALSSEGRFLAADVNDALLDHDSTRLAEILKFAVLQPQIREVSILDTGAMVLASTNHSIIGNRHPSTEPVSRSKPAGKFYLKSFAIQGRHMVGKASKFLQINYSLEPAFGDIASTLYLVIAIDSIEIIIILFVAWLISGILLKPLEEMRDISDKMANGDFSNRVSVVSDDVVGRLSRAFNTMAQRLLLLTTSMQQEIDRATSELTNRNRDLHEKHLQLEDSNRRLRELDMLKSDFISMVSHELRTPLTSIIGFAKTLRTLPLSKDQQSRYLDIIESEGKRLSSLVEEYLDISKIESGNISLQRRPVNIANLVLSAVDSFSISLRKGITVDLPPSMPDVMADSDHIARVLYNLIDNAIKYSGESQEIIVTAYVKEDGIAVSVRDFGAGVGPEDIDKVFGKFYRGKNPATLKRHGSGLGLAIAKGIIEAHNGKIWCESHPGKGSKFSFFLPLKHEGD